jgi:outer membrane protein assembly factor BamB
MMVCHGVSCVCVLFAMSTTARADNWPQFRGPEGNGLPRDSRLPTEWDGEKNLAWKVKLPGAAWSQPVVWGDRIFITTAVTENQPKPSVGQQPSRGSGGLNGPSPGGQGRRRNDRDNDAPVPDRQPQTSDADPASKGDGEESPQSEGTGAPNRARAEGAGGGRERAGRGRFGRGSQPPDQVYRWMIMCLDRSSGKVLWEQLAHEGKPTIATHRSNTFASETPVTDGRLVYAYFGMTGLYAYDLDGKLIWSKNLGSFPMMMGWGTGSSPVLTSDRLFVQCDNEQESFLVALDKYIGDELWRVPREEKLTWSTPFVWKNNKRTELVTAGGRKMRSYDLSDGHLLWEIADLRGRCSATPIGTDELRYVGVGGGAGGAGPLVAIRAGAEGDITLASGKTSNDGIAWSVSRAGPPMASPLVYQKCLYVLEQRGGIVGCYDAKTGQQHYRQRVEGAKGFVASPWAYDGKIFCLDEDGQTFVLTAGEELKVLATNKLDDTFWSSVAVAGGPVNPFVSRQRGAGFARGFGNL